MSAIREIRSQRVRVPLRFPFVTALRTTTEVESLIVTLVDDDGLEGWGEVPQVWRITGESLAGAEACLEGPIAAVLVGADSEDLQPLCRLVRGAVVGNSGAKAAVDVALHDLVARRRGVSLARFLGGTSLRLTTDVTVAAEDVSAMREASQDRTGLGFTTLKLKVGTDARSDVERVLAVRASVGPDVRLRLDANQGWTPRQAVDVIRTLEDRGATVQLVEQPVAARDVRGMAWVRDRVATPVMADESVFGLRDLMAVIGAGAADLVNIKLAKCGGLSTARTLIEVADEHGLGVMIGSMMETHVGVGAAASLMSAYGASTVADLDAAWWLETSPYRGGPTYDAPWLVLPDQPGLGVTGLRSVQGE